MKDSTFHMKGDNISGIIFILFYFLFFILY